MVLDLNPKMIECCIECNEKVKEVPNQPEMRVCLNEKCKLYKVKVNNWYNFEE